MKNAANNKSKQTPVTQNMVKHIQCNGVGLKSVVKYVSKSTL